MKKGFTLVELLVVVAIIAVLSVIVIPSVTKINKNINERLYSTRKEDISSGAELYANNNEEIFNGTNEAYIYVWELIDANYVTTDAKVESTGSCTLDSAKTSKGCVVNPTDKSKVMNEDYVILTKQGAGVSSEYVVNGSGSSNGGLADTLTEIVCDMFDKTPGHATDPSNPDRTVDCKCNSDRSKVVNTSGQVISGGACLFSGTDVNNHLRYGNPNSNKPNWRVLGVYDIGAEKLSPKMITSGAV